MRLQSLLLLTATLVAPTLASAQVTLVAFESFDYPWPALLHQQNGGIGWSDAWDVTPLPGNDGVVVQANPPTNAGNPYPWPEADAIGNYAQTATEWGTAIRTPSQVGHDDIVENGLFGKDGSTIWISVSMRNIFATGIHFGSVSFLEALVGEKWLLGSPWATYGWGIDACPGNGCTELIPNTDDTVSARLVVRVDYAVGSSGENRVRMWVDPPTQHPLTNPGLDVLIPEDLRFDQIQLWSGGFTGLYYWDNLVIEKGEPMPPAGFCFGDGTGVNCPCGNFGGPGEGCSNSTGDGALAIPTGSSSVALDNFGIAASNLPASQPALMFVGLNAINNGGGVIFGDGLRCAGGNVVRLGIQMPDANGDASWGPGLSTAGGWDVGDTRRFQVWYRDPIGSSCGNLFNLSNGVEATFTL